MLDQILDTNFHDYTFGRRKVEWTVTVKGHSQIPRDSLANKTGGQGALVKMD